ncbi:MAG: translation initiation factor IF-2, partial [Pirellulaceae bacterium]|nr:translation initiation factor IF-2 [Pirellulaceae bacterium]
MPIRIYALAKQLKLDSKVLVDICTKAGVTGKGSALASLTDEEMEKVTAYINSGKAGRSGGAPRPSRGGEPAAQPTVFRREDYISPTGVVSGKIPTLPPLKPAKPSPPA